MAVKAHRVRTGLALGGALLAAVALTSCVSPSFTYVADSGNNTYFKVPYGWQQVAPSDLCKELKLISGATSCPTTWTIAYEAGQTKPLARDFLSAAVARPFVFAEVTPYTSQTGAPLTDETLRDFFLPVTAAARAQYAAAGTQLNGFKQLRDATLKLGGGVHGVRETFDYSFPGQGSDTFDEVAMANSAGTLVYFMVLHCTERCYSQDKLAIDAVMSSFIVRSS